MSRLSGAPVLELKGVAKRFGSVTALSGVDLSFAPGFHGLLGPNGAGKTTLLRILAATMSPDRGAVCWRGRLVDRWDRAYRDDLGYLPQSFVPYQDLTTGALLTYLAGLKEIPSRLVPGRVAAVLAAVRMEGESSTLTAHLSGGLSRRLGIACALLNDPAILILDEPLTGLDVSARQEVTQLLLGLAAHKIVILSSHVTSDLEGSIARAIILAGGTVRACNSPRHLSLTLKGKVWQADLPADGLVELAGYYLPRIASRAGGYCVRVVGEPPSFPCRSAAPDLEDVFLWYTRPDRQAEVSVNALSP